MLTGYAVLHRRLQRALKRFLDTLDAYEAERSANGWNKAGNVHPPADDFLEVVYIAAELWEFYEADVPRLLGLTAKQGEAYRLAVRKLKREATLICNRCKHNYAYLQAVEMRTLSDAPTVGFFVAQRKEGVVKVIPEIHPERCAFSYNWAIRRLLFSLFIGDENAASVVKLARDRTDLEPLQSLAYSLPHHAELTRVLGRPDTAFPKEPTHPAGKTSDSGQELDLTDEPMGRPMRGRASMTIWVDVLGHSVTHEVPYLNSTMTANIVNPEGPDAPLPGFFRTVAEVGFDIES